MTQVLPEMEGTRAELASEAHASEAEMTAEDVAATNHMIRTLIFGGEGDDATEGFLDEINRYVATKKKEGRNAEEDHAVEERQAALRGLRVLHDALEHGNGL